jgi:hypothetical protein
MNFKTLSTQLVEKAETLWKSLSEKKKQQVIWEPEPHNHDHKDVQEPVPTHI